MAGIIWQALCNGCAPVSMMCTGTDAANNKVGRCRLTLRNPR